KRINDTYGHATGDALLAQFCQRVMGCLREEDKVYIRNRCVNFARLAGDEFALAILDVADQSSAEHIARRIFERLSSPFSLPGTEVRVHASIGILYIEAIEQPADALLIQADKAMYYAKQRGKNQYQFFDARLAEAISERKRIEMGLTRAVNENAFDLVFMPIVDTQTLRIVGAEALLRCSDEQLAGVAPESYILVAEQQGLIREIDLLVLEKAFSRIAAIESDPRYDHLTFAINISAIELHNQGFPARLSKLLVEHDIPPRRIELEITETALIAQDEASLAVLHELRAIGVGLSLDDFGTGYIAFNQLMNYPVGQLKIDRSFINALSECGPSDRSLVDIVIALAHHFDIDVVAEGVETIEQLEYLKARRCRYAQGFLFSRPLPWSQFIALCQSHGALDQGGAAVSPLSVGTKRLNIVS
ncbi:MAG: bifunctional diguanylate cyclase/phosphodiesterase, partial [Gammaproteobacteria bacterium]|nr:bifunctional diguanylate cyclase/phosphodiesterase [Gammaproteobacteria bacterium]